MKVCKRCLNPENHALNLNIDKYGLCSGCRVHEEKDYIDWNERSEKLKLILDNYRNKSGTNYDCIIPVSGGKDSYFIVHTIKNIYNMNPLLVSYNKQYNTSVGIRNLANLKIKFNCDIMIKTVNPAKVKKITRSTLRRFGSIYWHCIAGQTVYPVQMAVKLKIPLIIWGAHQGIDQVGMYSHFDEVEMTRKYRKEHDLMGYEAEDLINDFGDISMSDIQSYIYPSNNEIESIGVRGIYLNNYHRWDSKLQHESMIKKYGYETDIQNRTYDSYNDIDCWNYNDLHDYIKFIKFGYCKVVDNVCREIRLRHLDRSEGIKIILKYYKKSPKYQKLYEEWIGITRSSLEYLIDKHRNKNIWYRDENYDWKLKKNKSLISYLVDKKSQKDDDEKFIKFFITNKKKSTDSDKKYILIGRGIS